MQNLPKKIRSKKLNAKVDLTAMVSVSFLLIIFFMVTIELTKPKVIVYDTGADRGCCDCPPRHYGENRSMTIILGENNKIIAYTGLLFAPIVPPKELEYGKNGIRRELFERNKTVLEYSAALGKPGQGVTVIIKPSKKSSYGNLVDIIDEMKVIGITSYSIVDYYTPEEENLLASN
ncbi:ExbD/TolR family protein [Flavobacterium tructae]|uniref:Biopolymer transporter ExbD n=1 Tax=Flavobacterium tructae TaxID=1114873 RepID=A0A1S1J496_9FLAO|nr:biopolymer transporter ExbD [Flavobacterium tructae]OHT44006.1 biopolymer transporter ExbD [Flavobacterium tructae]OXB20356.1 biopolymer transporter ExbD [Flavobacterium tructae]